MVNLSAKITALFMALFFALSGVNPSVINYTEGTPIQPEKREYCFDNSGILIGGYYSREDELQYCEDAGVEFIVAGSVNKQYLDIAEKYGVGIIASSYNLPYCYANMTDAATQIYVDADPAAYKDHPALWGDNVIDEPWSDVYDNVGKSVDAYYSKYDGKIPFVNLFPSYAAADQLTEFDTLSFGKKIFSPFSDQFTDVVSRYKSYTSDYINKVATDYICVDIYPYRISQDSNGKTIKSTDPNWIRNLDILAEACRETGRDLWVIPQSAGLTKDGAEGKDMRWCDEVSDISQQDYASLAFGSKAIIYGLYGRDGWWDTDSHMIGSDGKPTDTYYAVKEVNDYIKLFKEEFGKYDYKSTYFINTIGSAGFTRGRLNCEVLSERGNIKSLNHLLVGTFAGENDSKAYVIANMEELNKEKDAKFTFDVPKGKTATVYYQNEVKTYTKSFKMELNAGGGAYITVK
ncbi:MAG: hypothetical protein MJ147_05890 [Clostridia bacterium]|nr:hypothetical protein [Clostridia bacterium]